MPRGLYGRAALILVFPVVFLQLLVSVVFIQRHFDGVTDQMTRAVSIELRFLRDLVEDAPDLAAATTTLSAPAEALEVSYAWPETIPDIGNDQPWTDLTGGNVTEVLMEQVPEVVEISLANRRQVQIWMDTNKGPLELSFARRRVSASNPHQLIVIMVVLGALMTTVSYFFLRNQLRPIKRMAAAAQAYGKGRIEKFTPTGAVEVRAAGTAFLDMRNRIERQTQSRTMMLSGVSHDLRTPLTRLRLGLSMLDEDEAAPMIRDVDDMQGLLDGFLDFARGEAGDNNELVDLSDLLSDVIQTARRGDQRVTLVGQSPTALQTPLRPKSVKRALENLISNALRYGSQAQVSCQINDRSVVFCVEDDGPGIPEDLREEAIKPFARLDPARNQDKGSGVGLGLAIVSETARTHGGSLRLGTSETLGGLKAELVLAR